MKITVALPVYNGANFIREALNSILSQSYSNFELLISEGGSNDGTADIIREYASRDFRIRYERTSEKLLQVPNCNRLLELAQTDWVQFMCHDDILLPGALERIVDAIGKASPKVALVGHSPAILFENSLAFDATVDKGRFFDWKPGLTPFPLLSDPPLHFHGPTSSELILSGQGSPCLPALTTGAVRRSALKTIGDFDPSYAQFDTRAWLRLLLRFDYVYIPCPLSLTRIHGGQVTAKLKNQLRTVEDCLRFWPAYVEEARSCGLRVPRKAKLLPLLKSSSEAAGHLYVTLCKGQWRAFRDLYWQLPLVLKFLVLPLLGRTSINECKRTRTLRSRLTFSQIYP